VQVINWTHTAKAGSRAFGRGFFIFGHFATLFSQIFSFLKEILLATG
jgi:hypothetical protein